LQEYSCKIFFKKYVDRNINLWYCWFAGIFQTQKTFLQTIPGVKGTAADLNGSGKKAVSAARAAEHLRDAS
jgi:hypothetical protein